MRIKVTPLPHYSETHVGLPRWTFEEASTRDLLGANVNIRINVKSSNLFVSSKRITYHKKGVLLVAAKLLGRPVRIPTPPPPICSSLTRRTPRGDASLPVEG